MIRAPHDTAPFSRTINGLLSYTGKVASPILSTHGQTVLQDKRPLYGYGNRTTVGGRVWIKPTKYQHYSRVVNCPGEAYIEGYTATIGGDLWRRGLVAPPVDSDMGIYTVVDDTNPSNASVVKALNSLASQKAGLGEDLATYMQLVHLFGGKASLLYDALNSFKHGRFRKFLRRSFYDWRKVDKKLADLYLEYVYGWKPLVSDVYGTYILLKEFADGSRPLIIHGHGTQKQNTTFQKAVTSTYYHHLMNVDEKVTCTCDIYGLVDPSYAGLRALNQLGLLNPAAIAWEATPWSFVVDWFVPIGPVLSALTASVGLSFISGTKATRYTRTFQGSYHCKDSAIKRVTKDVPTDYTVTDEGYSRTPLTSFPFPTPYFNPSPLLGDRPFKALALAISRLRG